MIDFLVIPLLPQLVIRRASFLSCDACLVKILLQNGKFVGEGPIGSVDFWDLRKSRDVQLALGFELEPFLLEGVQCLLHPELDEKVTQELI